MPKYRKRPVVIEAVQFVRMNQMRGARPPCFATFGSALPEWMLNAVKAKTVRHGCSDGVLIVSTKEGEMVAMPGDWIIQGVAGELYPCKPDIFERTYEEAGGERITAFKDPRFLMHDPSAKAVLTDPLYGSARYTHAELGDQRMVLEFDAIASIAAAIVRERERIRGNILRRLVLAQTRDDLAHYGDGLEVAAEMCQPEYRPTAPDEGQDTEGER